MARRSSGVAAKARLSLSPVLKRPVPTTPSTQNALEESDARARLLIAQQCEGDFLTCWLWRVCTGLWH